MERCPAFASSTTLTLSPSRSRRSRPLAGATRSSRPWTTSVGACPPAHHSSRGVARDAAICASWTACQILNCCTMLESDVGEKNASAAASSHSSSDTSVRKAVRAAATASGSLDVTRPTAPTRITVLTRSGRSAAKHRAIRVPNEAPSTWTVAGPNALITPATSAARS